MNAPLSLIPARANNGFVPCKGPAAIPILIDFSLGSTFSVDLSTVQSQGFIECVQTVFADNSANPFSLKISTTSDVSQTITIPPNSQAYLPILQTNPPKLSFTSNYTGKVQVELLNMYIAPAVWNVGSGTGTFNFDANGNVKTADQNLAGAIANNQVITQTQPNNPLGTDRSGTITTGGTVQQLAAANSSRKKLIVHNPSTATEILQICFGVNTAGRIDIAVGATVTFIDGVSVPLDAVFIVGATTAHAFKAYEW